MVLLSSFGVFDNFIDFPTLIGNVEQDLVPLVARNLALTLPITAPNRESWMSRILVIDFIALGSDVHSFRVVLNWCYRRF